jgi:hypothetical protein
MPAYDAMRAAYEAEQSLLTESVRETLEQIIQGLKHYALDNPLMALKLVRHYENGRADLVNNWLHVLADEYCEGLTEERMNPEDC